METDVEYYNTTYPPLEGANEFRTYENDVTDEFEDQQEETNQASQNFENVSSNNSTQHTAMRQADSNSPRTRSITLIDEDGYSFPSPSDQQSSPNSSKHSKVAAAKKSSLRKAFEWKYCKFFLILFGIFLGAIVATIVLIYGVKVSEETEGIIKHGRFVLQFAASVKLMKGVV